MQPQMIDVKKIDPLRLVKAVVAIDDVPVDKDPSQSLYAIWSAMELGYITREEWLDHANQVRLGCGLPPLFFTPIDIYTGD